jgi:hypothetical protein
MIKPQSKHPRSKVRARIEHPTSFVCTIPEKIVHAMRLQAGDSLEWIWTTEGFTSYCKIIRAVK